MSEVPKKTHLWVKGQGKIPGCGRPKGSKSRFNIKSVSNTLGEKGINPTEEILKIIPQLDYPEQLRAWFFLLTYTQARPMIDETPPARTMELSEKLQNLSDEELEKAVKLPDAE